MAQKGKPPPTSHEVAMADISRIGEEMAYLVKEVNYGNGPGPDIRLVNLKNDREAMIEVEVNFKRERDREAKYRQRYDEMLREAEKGVDVVLLVTGARGRDLLNLLNRAGVPNADTEWGKRVFTAVRCADPGEIRAMLLRCLG